MLGNVHVDMAFYGTIGTFINESGIKCLLSEVNILAEGSIVGLIKGKFYNHCTRIHDNLSTVLEEKQYGQFYTTLDEEGQSVIKDFLNDVPIDNEKV